MAATRLVLAVLAFASLVQFSLADDPPCDASEVGTLKCDTRCSTVGLCIGIDAWVAIEACMSGNVCDDAAGPAQCSPAPATTCRANPNPPPTDTVACMAVGKYASYENCYYYYDCTTVGDTAHPVSCPQGHVFDSCSGTCVAGDCTPRPVYCEDAEMGVDPTNNRNYYYCLGKTRYWFSCKEGHAYALVGKMCVETTMTNGCLCCHGVKSAGPIGGGETCLYLQCKDTGNIEVQSCRDWYYFSTYYNACYVGTCVSTLP